MAFPILPVRVTRTGTYKNPYVLGSSKDGSGKDQSSTPSVEPTAGPWTYASPNSDLSIAKVDTWHRDRPPTNSGGTVMDGVKLDLQRIFIVDNMGSYTFNRYVFTRTAIFDHLGILVSVSAELLEESDVTSGSGSAGGGI